MSPTPEALLDRYEAALDALEKTPSPSEELAFEVLAIRDEIQQAIGDRRTESPIKLLQLFKLDDRLKSQAHRIAQTIPLPDVRTCIHPPETSWWWFFEPLPHPLDRLDWLWNTLTLASLTAASSLLLQITSRFFSGGPDTLGTFAVSAQSLLTLLTARGALTETGREGIQHLLQGLRLPKHFWRETELGLSVLLLLSATVFYTQLPRVAEYYRDRGKNYLLEARFVSAEAYFERAVELDPDNGEAYYFLGVIHEDLADLERARKDYEIAVKLGYDKAYNNLARLYILDNRPEIAAGLLNILLAGSITDPQLRHFAHKNLGWARLLQADLPRARADLETALDYMEQEIASMSLETRRAHAYCLLAETLEKIGDPSAALLHWKNCLRYASFTNPDEDIWIPKAQQRIDEYPRANAIEDDGGE